MGHITLDFNVVVKGLASGGAKLVPLFIRSMTPAGVIWSRDQRTVKMR